MEKQKLPNATKILILGIGSILTSCCSYGFIGLITGIFALFLANRDQIVYNENPELYSNYDNLKIGRILAIIGIILSLIFLTVLFYIYITFGWEAMQDPDLLKELMEEKWGIKQ